MQQRARSVARDDPRPVSAPPAARGVTLLSEGVFHETEALAVIAGSRLGASFVVLAAGFLGVVVAVPAVLLVV